MSKFDYVIGNPPYVIGVERSTLYHKFIVLAEQLSKEQYVMLVPSAIVLDNRPALSQVRDMILENLVYYDYLPRNSFDETKKMIKDGTIINTGVIHCDKIAEKGEEFTVSDRNDDTYEVKRGAEFFDYKIMMDVYEQLRKKTSTWGYPFRKPGERNLELYTKLITVISPSKYDIEEVEGYQQDADKWRVATSYNWHRGSGISNIGDRMHLRVAHTIPPNVGLPMSKGRQTIIIDM